MLLLTAVLVVAGSAKTPATDTTTVYSLIGRDTVAVEQFTRSAGRLEGTVVSRVPRVAVSHYVAELGADGHITKVRIEPLRADRTPVTPVRYQEVTIGSDSLEYRGVRGDSVTTRRVAAAAGVVPFVHPFWSYGFYDQALRQSARAPGDSIPIVFYQVGAPAASAMTFVREGPGAIRITWRGVGTIHFRYGDSGEFLADNSLETTFKTEAAAGPTVDILRLAGDYAARDAAGSGLGVLSPRDTARATIGGASILIDYSRPSMRGRRLFGGVVPYGEVWRAGADAATVLTSSRDLAAGETRIPAGVYTLWIIPTEQGDTLLINSQTGQWGTQHDPAKDLYRIPLRRSALGAPMERYTIRVEEAPQGGQIHFEWETRRLTFPFRIP
jgi:hypothetical protein